nr:putative membrane protein c17a5.08 [Quercus suber]
MLVLVALLGYLAAFTSATALTYKLTPNEKECFYTHVSKAGSKIAFYFAVQSGGSFDVAYSVHGPAKEQGKDRIIMEGEKERQGDYVFTANEPGEYRFCFDNSLSTFSDKMVDFEISVIPPSPPPPLGSYNPSMPGKTIRVRKPRKETPRRNAALTFSLVRSGGARAGRRRSARGPAAEGGRADGAAGHAGGDGAAAVEPDLDADAAAEVLPHAGEPQLQHGAQHREAHLQLQPDRERPDGRHGRPAGLHRQDVLHRRAQRLRLSVGTLGFRSCLELYTVYIHLKRGYLFMMCKKCLPTCEKLALDVHHVRDLDIGGQTFHVDHVVEARHLHGVSLLAAVVSVEAVRRLALLPQPPQAVELRVMEEE